MKHSKLIRMRAFVSLGNCGSFAYPFLSAYRLVGVPLRLLTSCFFGVVLTPSNHDWWAGGSWNRRHVVCKNVLRLAGELPIVQVLNYFQPLPILRIFCMRGFAPPPTDPPWLYVTKFWQSREHCRSLPNHNSPPNWTYNALCPGSG